VVKRTQPNTDLTTSMFPTFPDKQDVTPEGYQQITDVVTL
jgi:hypothetical protein